MDSDGDMLVAFCLVALGVRKGVIPSLKVLTFHIFRATPWGNRCDRWISAFGWSFLSTAAMVPWCHGAMGWMLRQNMDLDACSWRRHWRWGNLSEIQAALVTRLPCRWTTVLQKYPLSTSFNITFLLWITTKCEAFNVSILNSPHYGLKWIEHDRNM